MSRSSKYPERFRQDAVALVRSSARPLAQVARELGVNHETLRTWVRNAERAENASGGGAGVSGQEQERELRELRSRVAELELEKEILRKAAAYFAKEMGR